MFLLCSLVMAIVVFLFTRNLPKVFQSETEIFTGIASGMNVESIDNSALDFFATNNDFDNLLNIIKSRQTLEEVGELLLVQHMMLNEPDPKYIDEESWGNFRFIMPQDLEDSLLVPNSIAETLENIRRYKQKYYDSFLVKLAFEDAGSPYCYKAIQRIQVYRLQNSDLVKISYTWSDPGICQNTLAILNDVFTEKLAEIKVGQSADVVDYFRDQTDMAMERLIGVEQRLKDFRIRNRIINYGEQTRSIAALKEQMEDEYQKEIAIKASAQSSVARLENQIDINKEIAELSKDILSKRKELAEVNTQIAKMEAYYNNERMLAELKERGEKIKMELDNVVKTRYQYSKTPEGIPVSEMLAEWLAYSLALDESKARLEVFENRKKYFRDVYDEFAPLGSEIARMEREILVEEKNYLELLKSQNIALMRQQSEALASGGLLVTVPPNYPLKPQKSKAMLLVMVAGVIGFILPFSIIVLLEFFDNTIKTPQRAEELTGLKLLGAYPNLSATAESRMIDMSWLNSKSVGSLSQNLRLEARTNGVLDKRPKRVLVFSTRKAEGKAFTTHFLAEQLGKLDFKVLVVSYKQKHKFLNLPEYSEEDEMDPIQTEMNYDFYTYKPEDVVSRSSTMDKVLPPTIKEGSYDYVFYIIPGVLVDQYPLDIVEHVDMGVCVVSATRSWNKADGFALNEFLATIKYIPRLIVNGVEPDNLEAVVGEIPKTRSGVRKIIKSLITMDFQSKEFKVSDYRREL